MRPPHAPLGVLPLGLELGLGKTHKEDTGNIRILFAYQLILSCGWRTFGDCIPNETFGLPLLIHTGLARRLPRAPASADLFRVPIGANDPLEGYKDLFWKGDEVAWNNLLRHYLLCLMQAILRTLEHGPDNQVTAETLPVGMINEHLNPEVRKVFDAVGARFFSDPELALLPVLLAGRSSRMSRNEFLSLMWPVHFRVFTLVCTTLQPEQPIPAIDAYFRESDERPLRLKESFAALNAMDGTHVDSADIVEVMTSKLVSAIEQTTFIQGNSSTRREISLWMLIRSTDVIFFLPDKDMRAEPMMPIHARQARPKSLVEVKRRSSGGRCGKPKGKGHNERAVDSGHDALSCESAIRRNQPVQGVPGRGANNGAGNGSSPIVVSNRRPPTSPGSDTVRESL
jgi:hypothetical protein